MTYQCIIVDDEPPSHEVLRDHIRRIPGLELIGNFYNAVDAGEFISKTPVDIVLLDIQMPEITGIQFLRSLQSRPVTIFSTAFRDYAFEGYELGVIDYLLKPIHFDRFEGAIRRAVDFLQMSRTVDTLDLQASSKKTFEMMIKSGTKRIIIDYRKIIFAQGLKDYTILHTAEQKYVVKGTVKALEEFLPAEYFMRVHKSFIIARHLIRIVQRNKIEVDRVSIPIGRIYKDRVDEYLASLIN